MERLAIINPWLSVWRTPTNTIKTILSKNPRFGLPFLAAIFGFPLALFFLRSLSAGESLSLTANFLIALLVCIPFGYIGFFIIAAILLGVGRSIDGKGHLGELIAVVAWANAPIVITLFTWFFAILYSQNSVFISSESTPATIYIIRWLVFIWSLVLLIKMNAEAQNLSIKKSVANILLVLILVFAIGLLLHRVLNNFVVILFGI